MKRSIHALLLTFPMISAVLSLVLIFSERSESKNLWLSGMSLFRAALALAALGLAAFSLMIFLNRRKQNRFLYYVSGFLGILSAEILLFSRFPSDDTRNLIPLIALRAKPLLAAMLFNALIWLVSLVLSGTKPPEHYSLFLFFSFILIYWLISSHIDRFAWQIDLRGNSLMCLMLCLAASLWYAVLRSDCERAWKTASGFLFFSLVGFCVTRTTGMWMGRADTPPKAYWHELAASFLEGRLDLAHPSGYHDLTLFQGKWFVPNPPLPGILLMPWVFLLGSAESVNMCVYSAVIAGINAGLFFLMLISAFTREGGPLYLPAADDSGYPGKSLSIAGWVTVLFVFGTDHLWLGTTGQMWFISQLLVVMFTLAGCICVICRFPAVCAGIMLGLGILCRPNIFPVWLCLLGLRLHQERPFPRFDRRKTIVWSLKSGIPVVIAVFLLLFYNKLRFDDWFDFGYVTINGADWILESVRDYGMFHPHFLKTNASVMLFGLPELDLSGERFFFQPHIAGYSMFLMTPPLIYTFRSFRKSWFSVGAWSSVLLSVALLLLYHNTGAEQIGYRYILDAAAPLALLTAAGMKNKTGVFFKVLTVFSILLSFTAIYWWYLGRV